MIATNEIIVISTSLQKNFIAEFIFTSKRIISNVYLDKYSKINKLYIVHTVVTGAALEIFGWGPRSGGLGDGSPPAGSRGKAPVRGLGTHPSPAQCRPWVVRLKMWKYTSTMTPSNRNRFERFCTVLMVLSTEKYVGSIAPAPLPLHRLYAYAYDQ